MKNIFFLCSIVLLYSFTFISCNNSNDPNAVKKTINNTAGNLSTALTTNEKGTISNLTITGTIDARDFVTLYYMGMGSLKILDLSNSNILAYSGSGGHKKGAKDGYVEYIADEIPYEAFSFILQTGGESQSLLISIKLPKTLNSISYGAFWDCTALTNITILNPTPPALFYDGKVHVFSDYTLKNCILDVPKGSKTLYQNQWGFTNIVEI
ncbi:MAG: leucine-rich repeat domain-containing protein [Paludibacter sp.]